MDEPDIHEITLFDDPLLGLTSQPEVEEEEVKSDPVENTTPNVKKRPVKSYSTGDKKSLHAKRTIFQALKTPEQPKRRQSRKKALWSVDKSLKKSSRSELSPWDRAIAQSPSLAQYVKETVKAQKKLDRVKLNVVEVDRHSVH